MIKKVLKDNKGITLTALIISISVIIFLSGIVFSIVRNDLKMQKLKKMQSDVQTLRDKISSYYIEYGAIPAKCEYTNTSHINSISKAVDTGKFLVIDLSAIDNLTLNYGRDYENIKNDTDFLASNTIGSPKQYTDLYIINSDSHNVFYVKGIEIDGEMYYTDYTADEKDLEEVEMKKAIKVTYNGITRILTKDTVGELLGKVVTNFKENYENGTEEVNGITVSKKYRLYYVDFDGKYEEDKQGRGTIYLKAECTNDEKQLQLDTISKDDTLITPSIKIKQLNPELYKEGKIAPNINEINMRAIRWLLNENNWSDLKKDVKIPQTDINYIVGAPSLEMMMDSYNMYYGLTGETPTAGNLTSTSPRTKLFYQYESGYGYTVGPGKNQTFDSCLAYYAIQSDSSIDTMYYPGNENMFYWLASPGFQYSNTVYYVSGVYRRVRSWRLVY